MKNLITSMLLSVAMCFAAQADIFWDAAGAGGTNWLDSANWDIAADGTGGNPTITTQMTDIATFNINSLNSDQLVTLGANISIGGLVFNNTGTTTITNTAARTITLGAGGITINSNAGAVVIGQVNPIGTRTHITLSASQTWINNSTNLFAKYNIIALGTNTLTVDGTGKIEINANAAGITGTGGIIKNGTNTLALGSATVGLTNIYTGVTTINAGILSAANFANGGALSSIGASSSDAGNLVFGGGTLAHSIKLSGSTDRLFTIGNASGDTATLDSSASATNSTYDFRFTNTGAIVFGTTNAHTLTLTGSSVGTNIFACALGDNGGATSLVKTNGGTWFLTGANSYSGGTTINGGMLVISGSSPLGATTGPLTLDGAVKLDLGGATQTVGAVKIIATIGTNGVFNGTLVASSYALSVGTVGAVLAGGGTNAVTKNGGNPIILNAANTYTNETHINAGKMAVNGSVQSALIVVNYVGTGINAILAGTGTVQAVTVNASGFLTVGDTNVVGTLNFNGDVLLSAGSTNIMKVYTNGFDVLNGNGANTLTMDGETRFDFTGNTVTNGATFHVLQNWSSIVTAGTFTAVGLTDTNLTLDTSALASSGYLTVVAAGGPSYTLTSSAGANGTVTPGTTNVVSGSNADFTVTADLYYRIATLTTNGTPVTGMTFDNSSTTTNFIWSNVQSTGTVAATFTAQLANDPAGTPYSWLAGYGLTNYNTDAVADQDGDGLKAWQEYIAGTDPTNAASCLKVAQTNRNTVTWSPVAGRLYSVYWSTNLVHGFTNLVSGITYPQGSYTNTTPDAKVNHYQVRVQLP